MRAYFLSFFSLIVNTLYSTGRYSTDMFQPPVSTSSGSHSPSSSPGKVKKTDEVGTDEEDSRMEEDISEGDDVDTELAAEMIIRDSPHQSSDEDERERGAVGGESRRKKDESPRDKKTGGVATGKISS